MPGGPGRVSRFPEPDPVTSRGPGRPDPRRAACPGTAGGAGKARVRGRPCGAAAEPGLPPGRAAETPRRAPPLPSPPRPHAHSGASSGIPARQRGDPRSGQWRGAAVPRPGEGIPALGTGNGRAGRRFLGPEWSLTWRRLG